MYLNQYITIGTVLLAFLVSSLNADTPLLKNPLNTFITVPFKTTFDKGATSGDGTILRIMPLLESNVGDWHIFHRTVIPLANVDGAIVGPSNPSPEQGGSSRGLGDINYSLLFSPINYYDTFMWGVGPTFTIPSASSNQLGSGKWSTGIAGMALTNTGWGNIMVRGRQIWSFAGDSDRKDVSQMVIEPIVTYNIGDGWHLFTDMIVSANWNANSSNRWIVPLGGGFGRSFKIGNQRILSRLEAYYNVEKPEGASDYSVSFTLQFVFPK